MAPWRSLLNFHSLCREHVDDIAKVDLLAHLEATCDLPETLSLPSVRVELHKLVFTSTLFTFQLALFRHQRQAQIFKIKRERGWDFSCERGDVWKRQHLLYDAHTESEEFRDLTGI